MPAAFTCRDAYTVTLSPIVFGTMGLPALDLALRTRLVHCAIDHGITSFDTAPLYGAGAAERVLGAAIVDRRSRVQILTKCGVRWDADHGQPMFEMCVDGVLRAVRKDSRPAGIREEIEASLKRLRVETIDLLQVHHFDDQVPVDDVMAELDAARAAGKVRAIGVSNYPSTALEHASRVLPGGLFSTQDRLNLLQPDRAGALEFARTTGAAYVAYEPLARGVLAGKYMHAPWDRDRGEPPRGLAKVNAVLSGVVLPIARAYDVTLAQIALHWVLAQPGKMAAIAGASSEAQVAENALAANLRLSAAELGRVEAALRDCGFEPDVPPGLVSRLRRRVGRVKGAMRRRLLDPLRRR
jgi:aryl-alcohol dehydrogenase-like predicted oxidoreductase